MTVFLQSQHMFSRKTILLPLLFATLFSALFFVAPAYAQDVTGGGGGTPPARQTPTHFFQGIEQCQKFGNCTICDFFKLFANIAKWILGTIGALSLFWVIYGGFDILTSAGSATKVDGGKKKIMGAIIGMLIVLAAWTLVNAIILFLVMPTSQKSSADKNFDAKNLFITPGQWSKIPCE